MFVPPVAVAAGVERPALIEPRDSVFLRDAVALALLNSPDLAAFAWELRAREARLVQAGRLPNPALDVMVEDIGASGRAGGATATDQVIQPQTTMQLGQLIELGGKRTARRDAAARTRDLAAWDYEAARMNVLTRVTRDFIDVLTAQDMVALTAQTTSLVTQVQQSVAARVEAGVVSPIEENRAGVSLASVRIESARAVRMLDAARRRLASNWGASEPTFAGVAGQLSVATALPAITELQGRLASNPDLARWAVEILQREALVASERAKRVPDVTLSGGYRRFTDLQRGALVIGASIPLPVFDRNAGAITEARSLLAKSHEERRGAEARVFVRLADAYQALASAHDELTAVRTAVLPGSRQTFEAVSEGYRAGKFGFLDVLDAQRTLIAAGGQYVRALAEYHKAVADIERIIGMRMSELTGERR